MNPRSFANGSSAIAALALFASGAAAGMSLERHPALECVRTRAGQAQRPAYPPAAENRARPGSVEAYVSFTGGQQDNEVRVTSSDGGPEFGASAAEWLRQLEAPCLQTGQKVELRYQFTFAPEQGSIAWRAPTEAGDEERRRLLKCIAHRGGLATPIYPPELSQRGLQGRLLARFTFAGPNAAPVAEVDARPAAAPFQASVREWLADLRMPCHPGGEPVKVTHVFVFRLTDLDNYGFRPLALPTLLGLGKGVRERPLSIDTTQMGCPFVLRMTYFQPVRRNAVGQVGPYDARREALTDLLRNLELDLEPQALDSVFADTAEISVPCLRLNHTPRPP